MKLKFDKALSLVAISVFSVIGSVQAAPVYEIVNMEDYDLLGTLDSTRNGYALGVDANDNVVGISRGTKKLDTTDIESTVIDVADGISASEAIKYSIFLPIVANNFAFTASGNSASTPWKPEFISLSGTTIPGAKDSENKTIVNSVDTFLYGVNDQGVKVGGYTGKEKKQTYTGTLTTVDFWYYRDFEQRGLAVVGDTEYSLVPPYTTYVRPASDGVTAATVELGGTSLATDVNANNIVTGYGSTDLVSFSKTGIDTCITGSQETTNPDALPLDICVQVNQYPTTNGFRNIQYQIRPLVWDLNNLNAEGNPAVIQLDLGLTPEVDSGLVYTAQGLGINSDATVVGRSHVYRNNDTNQLYLDAAYWQKDATGAYKYHWVPMDSETFSSISYDINDDGLLVGNYRKYLNGYLRDKFFVFDTKNPEAGIVTPNDFLTEMTDLSSKPKDVNNNGQVVGFIEASYEKEKPRPKVGFLFDNNTKEFVNLNNQLQCESKGYMQDSAGNWVRHQVKVKDGSDLELTYNTDINVVEANSINDDGTIAGTAFIRKPVYQTDVNGNLILGANGLPLFQLNANNQPVTSYLPRMVVLKPTNGTACAITDAVIDQMYERKGAASFAALFMLPLLWIRRRYQQK